MVSGNFAEMTPFSTPFKDLLHAENLRHGTNGFTSPPKKGMLRIFSPEKFGFELPNFGTRGQHAKHYTTEAAKPVEKEKINNVYHSHSKIIHQLYHECAP
jgi:hypothetical protein